MLIKDLTFGRRRQLLACHSFMLDMLVTQLRAWTVP